MLGLVIGIVGKLQLILPYLSTKMADFIVLLEIKFSYMAIYISFLQHDSTRTLASDQSLKAVSRKMYTYNQLYCVSWLYTVWELCQ